MEDVVRQEVGPDGQNGKGEEHRERGHRRRVVAQAPQRVGPEAGAHPPQVGGRHKHLRGRGAHAFTLMRGSTNT